MAVENLRGSLFMVLSMSAFALEDMFVKEASQTLPVGEIMALFGLGGTFVFSLLTLGRHEPLCRSELLSRPIILRAVCEVTGRLCFILAIALTPLVVVMGAALFFGEIVGWRRWTAVFAERPDAMTLTGSLVIVLSGLYPLIKPAGAKGPEKNENVTASA